VFHKLLENEFVILDGAMGTMLQAAGLPLGGIPEEFSVTHPELLVDIHKQYIAAGSQIIYANTFGANRYKMADSQYEADYLIEKAIENAKTACAGTDCLVALDIGPIGQMLVPSGNLSFEEAYDMFKQEVLAGKEADLIVIETMTDLLETKAALLAAKENSDKPVLCTMTFEQNHRTFTGVSVSSMALTLQGLGADAIGLNCSLGPKEMYPIVEELAKWVKIPMILKPNAGLPDPVTNHYDVTPEEFSQYMKECIPLGVKIFGGCCGTTPAYIKALTDALKEEHYVPNHPVCQAAICSPSKTVVIDGPRVIGERINPTGKKRFKEALQNHDIGYILSQGIEQVKGGAEILDVNVGLPGIDERAMMVETVTQLQGILDVPLQIDSTIPEVLEAALRCYNGKPIVNSVNGEQKSIETVLPLVKKYGAAVVGLTLDENGIPKSAEERFAIAKRILDAALAIGIPKEDVFIDCLTLTVSAEQAACMETVKALHRVKEELGLKTVLGVSNISFGLPNREMVNHNFLMMAMTQGLDLPIINPNVVSMMGAVRSYRLLTNIDKDARDYIANYSNVSMTSTVVEKNVPAGGSTAAQGETKDIFYAIYNGLKEEGSAITREMLKTTDAMEIINEMLIPALDEVGKRFEAGTVFLPQLILSAEVAKAAFAEIKTYLVNNNAAPIQKGKIVIATVKGDIHDIGKNIVKVLLENYGYQVIDLGKDVPYEAVVEAVQKENVKLVGLSALMTTTLVSMEKTIALLRENHCDCKVMVGGAVLTPEYAKQIGADYYSKDAKQSVDIAKEVLG
jgi:5-methyltetrahydrofolate--homocysteine methyltransferase